MMGDRVKEYLIFLSWICDFQICYKLRSPLSQMNELSDVPRTRSRCMLHEKQYAATIFFALVDKRFFQVF